MAVPLFDTETPLAPLRAAILERLRRCVDAGALHPRPGGRGVRARSSPPTSGSLTWSASRTGPTRSRSRCAALGVRPGDEVVVPSFTFYATAEAVVSAGARPVFCDVDPATRNVTPDTVRAALTPRTQGDRRRRPVRLPGAGPRAARAGAAACSRTPPRRWARASAGAARGRSATPRRSRSIPPRTSAASATAARSPPTTTRVAELARALRFHGSRDKQTFEYVGYNSRLDEIQAAVLRVLLPELDRLVRRPPRRGAGLCGGGARRARRPARGAAEGAEPAWHLYVVTHRSADALVEALTAGVARARLLPHAAAPAAGDGGVRPRRASCPRPTSWRATNLALPMSPRAEPRGGRARGRRGRLSSRWRRL